MDIVQLINNLNLNKMATFKISEIRMNDDGSYRSFDSKDGKKNTVVRIEPIGVYGTASGANRILTDYTLWGYDLKSAKEIVDSKNLELKIIRDSQTGNALDLKRIVLKFPSTSTPDGFRKKGFIVHPSVIVDENKLFEATDEVDEDGIEVLAELPMTDARLKDIARYIEFRNKQDLALKTVEQGVEEAEIV